MNELLKAMIAVQTALHDIPDTAWADPPTELVDQDGIWLVGQLRLDVRHLEEDADAIVKHIRQRREGAEAENTVSHDAASPSPPGSYAVSPPHTAIAELETAD